MISGDKFNRLMAIDKVGYGKWLFECDCGVVKTIQASAVERGRVKSCGCLHLEKCRRGDNRTVHGHTHKGKRSPTHATWSSMIRRCKHTADAAFNDYGGRGISVCDKWIKFTGFLSEMGEKPAGKTLERLNNDAGYNKENCIWASRKVQARNRRNTRWVIINGIKKSLAEWVELDKNIGYGQAQYLLNKGISPEKVFNSL